MMFFYDKENQTVVTRANLDGKYLLIKLNLGEKNLCKFFHISYEVKWTFFKLNSTYLYDINNNDNYTFLIKKDFKIL